MGSGVSFGDREPLSPNFGERGLVLRKLWQFGTPMSSLGMIFRAESGGDGLVAQNLATTTEIEHRIFECPELGRPEGHFL